jgi:hypothetical protein
MKSCLSFLKQLAVLVGFLPLLTMAAERPNIVVFISDDHTWRDSSVYGANEGHQNAAHG